MAHGPKISVVVPVYNEHDNIAACLLGLWNALSGAPHEILVCYDFDEDTTLAAIAAMPDRPPTLRLVKNTIGRGAANALRAGFAAATGDVVVTTMADLSDPPQDILRMAELMRREGLAVVAGSRYMRGGSQSGGPWLKRTLSRLGGLSLRWIAGLGTRDATSNFRAYSKSFLERVDIESRTGFEIALELTVKAHAAGLGVGEVPTSWTDRTAGESRFRLWRWLPNYARWWLRAAWQPLVVGLVWIVMTLGAVSYVGDYGSPIPLRDDLELVPFTGPDHQWTLKELWTPHNEHRLPLPRPIKVAVLEATGDLRALMLLEVAIFSGLALAAILVVRRIRGRTSVVDILFPLLWLHTGNCENLLMGFQLALAIPAACVCAILLVLIRRKDQGASVVEALVLGACLFALPLCGALGLVQVPALWVGLAFVALASFRGKDVARRRGGVVLGVFLLATAVLSALYLVGLPTPPRASHAHDPTVILAGAARVLTVTLGPAGQVWWPFSGIGIGAVVAASLVLLCRAWWRAPAERQRAVILACTLGAGLSFALAIGFGRAGDDLAAGFAMRYIPMLSPVVLAAACAWIIYGGRVGAQLVLGGLAVALLAANATINADIARAYGGYQQGVTADIRRDLEGRLGPRAFVQKWTNDIYPDAGRLYLIVTRMAQLRIAPFDQAPESIRQRYTQPVSNLLPARIESAAPPREHIVEGWWPVLLVEGQCAMHFVVPPDTQALSGCFGVAGERIAEVPASPVRVVVACIPPEATERLILLDRTLDPVNRLEDGRTQSFAVTFPPGTRHVVIRFHDVPGSTKEPRWVYWGDLYFE